MSRKEFEVYSRLEMQEQAVRLLTGMDNDSNRYKEANQRLGK